MGADGWLYLLDADRVDAAGYNPFDDFFNVYKRTIFGRNVYTVYWDTEHHELESHPVAGDRDFARYRDAEKHRFDERRGWEKTKWHKTHTGRYSDDETALQWEEPKGRGMEDYKQLGFVLEELEVWT